MTLAPTTDRSTRKYRRPSPEAWAAAVAAWRTGASTLEEIASGLGMSVRGVQYRLAKEGARKGEAIAEDARRIERETIEEAFGDQPDRLQRGKRARQSSLDLAERIERAASSILTEIEATPSTAGSYAGSLRALSLAAQLVERTFAIKSSALGLSPGDLDPEELPQIIIRDLSEEELEAIRAGHGDDDEDEEVDCAFPSSAEERGEMPKS
jgi:hypothetical protein